MNTTFDNFGRQLEISLSVFKSEDVNKQLAAFARRAVSEVIRTGRGSPNYDLFVNGTPAITEDSVKAPGPILYVFSNWRLIIEMAIAELQKYSPRKSGRYAASFIVIADGQVVTNYATIPGGATVTIVNWRPYTRKIETGANGFLGMKHFENAKGAVSRRFNKAFSVTTTFLQMRSGVNPEIPYILRRSNGRRKDSQAGMPITYPALVLKAK